MTPPIPRDLPLGGGLFFTGQELRTGAVNHFPQKTWGSLVSIPGKPLGHQPSGSPRQACMGPWLIRRTCAVSGCHGMCLLVCGRGRRACSPSCKENSPRPTYRQLRVLWGDQGSSLVFFPSSLSPTGETMVSWRPPGNLQPLTGPIPSSKSIWMRWMTARRGVSANPAAQCCWV